MSNTYGLQIKKKEEKKKITLHKDDFSDSDDDREKVGDPKQHINNIISKQYTYTNAAITNELSKNLAEDPNVNEYDAIYEDISSERKRRKDIQTQREKPKYINKMIENAERRRLEQSIITEETERKKLLREGKVSETPKYVTKGYEKQLEINERKKMLLKLDDKYDEKNSVLNKETGMMGFYANLFTKNSAYGGGRRGEGDVDMVEQFNARKKEMAAFIDVNIEKEMQKSKASEDVIDIVKPSTQNDHNVVAKEKGEEKAITEVIDAKDKAEEYKKRYLERKRYRDDNK
jgi:hypothetical protein